MTKIILMLVVLITVAILGPILTIWALNTLFPSLAIPTTLETWSAVILLGIAIRGDGISFKDKS
jgi:hypothetical protein